MIMVPFAAIRTVPIAALAWYRLQCYTWYRYSDISNYNGKEITLTPSIGNYEFLCQSHYFIRHNMVEWCTSDSDYKRSKWKKTKKCGKR